MNTQRTIIRAAATLLIFALISCGVGSPSAPSASLIPTSTNSIGRTGLVITLRTTTGLGSVIQNRIKYNTTTAIFPVDGANASRSDLAVGHVAVVKGTIEDDNSGVVKPAQANFLDMVDVGTLIKAKGAESPGGIQ